MEFIKNQIDRGIEWLKKHPGALPALLLGIVGLYVQWSIIGLSFSRVEVVSMEAAMQVLTTGAEVVAGLYGLTLTGYIFFLDNLQERVERDELLEDIISLLKKRYHNTVLLLSVNSLVVIVMSFMMILYNTESQLMPEFLYRLLTYETIFLMLVDVALIVYFVIMMVDPDKISKTGLQYKNKISTSDKELGSLQEFLQDYEDIERLLLEKSESLAIAHIGSNPWKAIKQLKGSDLAKNTLLIKITRIGQYYNYMVFSQELIVTKEMCLLAKEVKQELEQIVVAEKE